MNENRNGGFYSSALQSVKLQYICRDLKLKKPKQFYVQTTVFKSAARYYLPILPNSMYTIAQI